MYPTILGRLFDLFRLSPGPLGTHANGVLEPFMFASRTSTFARRTLIGTRQAVALAGHDNHRREVAILCGRIAVSTVVGAREPDYSRWPAV